MAPVKNSLSRETSWVILRKRVSWGFNKPLSDCAKTITRRTLLGEVGFNNIFKIL